MQRQARAICQVAKAQEEKKRKPTAEATRDLNHHLPTINSFGV